MSDIVKEIIARAVKDEKFRKALFANPKEALQEYKLSPEDWKCLSNLTEENLIQFSGDLGDSATEGWLPGAG